MVTITLPQELEKVLTQRAQQQNTTADLLAIDSLIKMYTPPSAAPVEEGVTLAEYWADYIGSIDSSEIVPEGAQLSENTGRKFAELMVKKYSMDER